MSKATDYMTYQAKLLCAKFYDVAVMPARIAVESGKKLVQDDNTEQGRKVNLTVLAGLVLPWAILLPAGLPNFAIIYGLQAVSFSAIEKMTGGKNMLDRDLFPHVTAVKTSKQSIVKPAFLK